MDDFGHFLLIIGKLTIWDMPNYWQNFDLDHLSILPFPLTNLARVRLNEMESCCQLIAIGSSSAVALIVLVECGYLFSL